MTRFLACFGAFVLGWSAGGIVFAANPSAKKNQPETQPPAPAPVAQPAAKPLIPTAVVNQQQAQATRAAQLQARAEAMARAKAANDKGPSPHAIGNANGFKVQQPSLPYPRERRVNPYGPGPWGYGNSNVEYYSPYGYSPYVYRPYVNSPYGYSPYAYSPYGSYNSYGDGYSPYTSGYVPAYGTPYPYGGYPYQYSPYRRFFGYAVGYPPVFMNAGQLFGPAPIQQMLGGNPGAGLPQFNAGVGGGVAAGGSARADSTAPDVGVGGRAVTTAMKFIDFGDAHFANQKYSDALGRYSRAAQQSPKIADAWFRQGFAAAALGQYDRAAKAFHHGLELKADWADSDFKLDELYGGDAGGKATRLDAMQKAADADKHNGELAFVVGVNLYFDGKAAQAAPYFRRAADLTGNDVEVKGFLAKAN